MTTRRVPSERRAAALAEMSALLSSSLDYERTLPRLVRLAVPALGDLCAIDLLHDESGLHRVACAHVDAAREPLVHEIGTKHAGDSTEGQGVSAVIRTRRPVLVARATEADLRAAAQNAEQLALFRQLGPKSWIVTPLVAHDRVLGAMTLALTESGRRYGPMDLASATVVASHAATMIENGRRAARPKRRTARRTNSSRRSRTSCATRSTPCTGGRH